MIVEAFRPLRKWRRASQRAGVVAASLALAWPGCSTAPVPDPAVRYIAFGDSATAGPSTRNYPDILRELLVEAPETFVNEGESGETAGQGVDRLQNLLSQGLYPNAHTLLYWQGGGGLIDFIAEIDPLLLLSPSEQSYPHASRLGQVLDGIQANFVDNRIHDIYCLTGNSVYS